MRVLFALLAMTFTLAGAQFASAQSNATKAKIEACWRNGAFTISLMYRCTGGLFVGRAAFLSCIAGGPCDEKDLRGPSINLFIRAADHKT